MGEAETREYLLDKWLKMIILNIFLAKTITINCCCSLFDWTEWSLQHLKNGIKIRDHDKSKTNKSDALTLDLIQSYVRFDSDQDWKSQKKKNIFKNETSPSQNTLQTETWSDHKLRLDRKTAVLF